MNKILLNDIKIYYDDTQTSEIEHIKNVIAKNYELFLSILDDSKILSLVQLPQEEGTYVSDFDAAFRKIITSIFSSEFSARFNNTLLYLEYLTRKNQDIKGLILKPNTAISDELLYSLIAYKYYTETATFEDFVKYMETKNESDTTKIISWLQGSTRFDAYNILLKGITDCLDEKYPSLTKCMEIIVNMVREHSEDVFLSNLSPNKTSLPTATDNEIFTLFSTFLTSINAPEDWMKSFTKLQEENRITFEKKKSKDNSACYVDENKIVRLLISTDGTMASLVSMAHEFAHYIGMEDEVLSSAKMSISEFPSIFFEKLACNYLLELGCDEEAVTTLIRERNISNEEKYIGLSTIFSDMLMIIKDEPITREAKLEQLRCLTTQAQKTREDLKRILEDSNLPIPPELLVQPQIDIYEAVDTDCDNFIELALRKGLLVMSGYEYLLDTYLADEVLKKSHTDNTVIPEMFNIAANLGNIDLKYIVDRFKVEGLTDNQIEREKTKIKTDDKSCISTVKNTD